MAKTGKMTPSNIIVWVILALLIVGLMGFGATNFGGRVDAIGKVGGTSIPVTRYANLLQQEMGRVEKATGQQVTMAQARAFGLDQAVLTQVVGLTALEDEAADLGISVGDAAVRDEILKIQAFQGLDGNFDREAYKFALDRQGLKTGEFEDTIRTETARSLLQGAAIGGVATPPIYTDTLYAYAREARDLSWTEIGVEDLPEPIGEATDSQLDAYYAEHKDDFRLPERRQITYAWVTPERLASEIEVDEATLRNLYDARIDEYMLPERRLVERLVFGTEDEAAAAKAAIEAGDTTIEALVAQRGLDLADIDLGDVTRDTLGDAAEAVFSLDGLGIAGPVPTALGPALFRVNGVLPAREIPFEDAVDELRPEAARDAARRRIDEARDEFDDLLAGGATLEELADETEMTLGDIAWSADLSEGIAGYDAFRTAAQAASEDDFPELIELSDGGLLALRLDRVIPSEVQPFEDVVAAVAEAWTDAEIANLARQEARRLLALLEDGSTPDAAGVTLASVTGLTRDGFVEGAPVETVTTAFDMEEATWRLIETPAGAVLLHLDAIHAAPEDDEAAQIKQSFAAQTAQGYAQDMLDAFTSAVQAAKGLELDQAAINAVHAQFP